MEHHKKLSLGIIGLSEGNGHPYSWAAIFNGYNDEYMKHCPFQSIYKYLSIRSFPKDGLASAEVTHIWTQDESISKDVAHSANIEHVVSDYRDMIGQVDAILLARDDGERHLEMSIPFIEAGMPIFIDKPLAYTLDHANKILAAKRNDRQVFSCSALRYAKELKISHIDKERIGEIKLIDVIIPNSWERYAIHMIEPIFSQIGNQGEIVDITKQLSEHFRLVVLKFESGLNVCLKAITDAKAPLAFTVYGTNSYKTYQFADSFSAFKKSLETFISVIQGEVDNIPEAETLRYINFIEQGLL